LSVLGFVEEGEDVGNAEAGEAIRLIVCQNVEILVVSLDEESVLLAVALVFAVQGIFEGDVGQAQEAVGVIADHTLQHEFELGACFVQSAHVEKYLAFEAVLVHWSLCPALAGFIDPVQASVEVSAFSRQVRQPQECVDIIRLLADYLLV